MKTYYYGDEIFIMSGKYTSYYGRFVKYLDDNPKTGNKMVMVRVNLSPEPIIRTLRIKLENIMEPAN